MPCVVKIGDAPVITGYVDRYIPSFNRSGMALLQPDEASVRTSLIVQLNGRTGRLAVRRRPRSLASSHPPMGLAFAATFRGFALSRSSTSCWARLHSRSSTASANTARCWPTTMKWEIWCYRVGTKMHASGFFEGLNVEAATAEFSADQCFQTYKCYLTSINVLGGDNDTSGNLIETVRDPGVAQPQALHHRRGGSGLCQSRTSARHLGDEPAQRTVARCAVVVDSWFDSAGELWTPNRLAPVYLPSLKISDGDGPLFWIIAEVSYLRGQRGTQAEILLMAPEAFEVAPMPLNYGFVDGATVQGYGEWDDECGTDVQDGPPAAVLGRASQGHHLR